MRLHTQSCISCNAMLLLWIFFYVFHWSNKAIIPNRQIPLRNHMKFLHMGADHRHSYTAHNTEYKSQTTHHTTQFNEDHNKDQQRLLYTDHTTNSHADHIKYPQALLITDQTALFSTDHITKDHKTWLNSDHATLLCRFHKTVLSSDHTTLLSTCLKVILIWMENL